jgi:hypothetical protein
MAKITFRGARIDDWTGKHDDTGQKFELYMIADFSDKVREALGWTIEEELGSLFPKLRDKDQNNFDRACLLLPANIKTVSLDGDLAARTLELIPNDRDRKTHAIDLVCSKIKNFSLHRTKEQNGSFNWELQFTAVVIGEEAAQKVAAYITAVGSKPAQMPVGYDENKQEELEMEPAAADGQEVLIPAEQAADTAEEADEPGGPTLASSREVGGARRGARAKVRTMGPVN